MSKSLTLTPAQVEELQTALCHLNTLHMADAIAGILLLTENTTRDGLPWLRDSIPPGHPFIADVYFGTGADPRHQVHTAAATTLRAPATYHVDAKISIYRTDTHGWTEEQEKAEIARLML
jgi:hypothetical protein